MTGVLERGLGSVGGPLWFSTMPETMPGQFSKERVKRFFDAPVATFPFREGPLKAKRESPGAREHRMASSLW